MRKAVIAVPPVRDFYFTPHRASALGACALSREMQATGWETTVLNLPLQGKPRTIPLPGELAYLKQFIMPHETGPLSWFTAYHHFGSSFTESAEMVARENPDILCISSIAWAYAEDALLLAEAAALIMPDLPIIIGGHGPASLPEYFLNAAHPVSPNKPLFALVVSGEIEGSGRKIAPGVTQNRHLDLRKATPDSPLKPIAGESICRDGRRSISITLTRGCPFKCRFCSNHINHGRKFRVSPPKLWEEELSRISPGAFNLNFEDDNLLLVKKDLFHFLESLKKHYPDITFTAKNGLDYMHLNLEDIDRLKNWDFTHLNLSLAVLSEESLIRENRDGSPRRLEELINRCNQVKLPVTTHFICGLSDDKPEGIVKTLRFLDRLPTRIGISSFYPVPGLEGLPTRAYFLTGHLA